MWVKEKAVPSTDACVFLAARDRIEVQSQLFCLALARGRLGEEEKPFLVLGRVESNSCTNKLSERESFELKMLLALSL